MTFTWDTIDTNVNPALTRLADYNSNPYNVSTNPHGFAGGGHITQFPAANHDTATFANACPDFADLMSGYADAAAASAVAAGNSAANLSATSATSIAINSGSKTFTTQSGKTFPSGSYLLATSDANPTTHWIFIQVTSYSSTTLQGTAVAWKGSGSRADWTIRLAGVPGISAGHSYLWSTNTTNSDPTSGVVKVNAGTLSSTTALYISETDFDGNSLSSVLSTWDDSTSTVKGRLLIVQQSLRTNYLILDLTGTITDNGAWDAFVAQYVTSGGTLADGALCSLIYLPQANKGDTGATGDTGAAGSNGTNGRNAGIPFVWSTNNSATDPTSAHIKIDNATPSSVMAVYFSGTDSDGKATSALMNAACESLSAKRGRIDIYDASNPANFISLDVTSARTDNGGWSTASVTHRDHGGTLANGTAVLVLPVPNGDKGDTGATGSSGAAGATGPVGPTVTIELTWSTTTTDSDPGGGIIRANSNTYSAITYLYIDNADVNAGDIQTWLDSWDDSTTTGRRGDIIIKQVDDPAIWVQLYVSGVVIDGTGYRKVPVTYVGNNGTIADGKRTSVFFSRTGNKGSDGAGSGSVNSAGGGYTAGHFVTYADTSGDVIQDGGAFTAATIPNVPAGNISSSTVQAAINELDTEKQPVDATLTALAGVTTAADKLIYATGSDTFSTTDLTSVARTLVAQTTQANMRSTGLGLGTISTAASTDYIASTALDTDGTLSANSDTKVASQKAVKTYADALIAANDAMVFKGAQDCSANPNYPAANRGDTYRVSVAGKIGGASGVNVEAGDIFICNTDSTASGNQATVGAYWNIIQTNIDGAVVGPASSTDTHVAVFSGTTGKVIADGGLTLGTVASYNTGTSGGTVPLLNGANTWSGVQSYNDGDLSLKGSSSGAGVLHAPAAASTYSWTLPAANVTLAGLSFAQTWSAAQTFNDSTLKLAGSSSGTGTLVAPAAASTYVWTLPSSTSTLATTDASSLTSGTLPDARLSSNATAYGTQDIWIPAGSMTPNTTNGPATGSVETSTNKVMIGSTLDFDASTSESAQFSWRMPVSWNEGTITFDAEWSHASTTTNFGVVWELSAMARSDNEDIDAAFGTGQTSTDTGGTTNRNYISPVSSAITVGQTPSAGDVVWFKIARLPANASDTMAIDARLTGITIHITTDAGHD